MRDTEAGSAGGGGRHGDVAGRRNGRDRQSAEGSIAGGREQDQVAHLPDAADVVEVAGCCRSRDAVGAAAGPERRGLRRRYDAEVLSPARCRETEASTVALAEGLAGVASRMTQRRLH